MKKCFFTDAYDSHGDYFAVSRGRVGGKRFSLKSKILKNEDGPRYLEIRLGFAACKYML